MGGGGGSGQKKKETWDEAKRFSHGGGSDSVGRLKKSSRPSWSEGHLSRERLNREGKERRGRQTEKIREPRKGWDGEESLVGFEDKGNPASG